MCGIAGIINHDPYERADRPLLESMTRTLSHRGPDAEGYFLNNHVGLGHRRLKIIDLEGGVQPLFNEDGTVAVVYNGEIYNFEELKRDLEARGHVFRTHCDTEVIVHAYEEHGVDCPRLFRGMFSFAVYDGRRGRVFLARDRLGVKPLYYYSDRDRVLFGSEIKAVLKALGRRPGVNAAALDFHVSIGYSPGEETLFEGIRKLPPGHGMVVQGGEVRIRKYWDLEDTPVNPLPLAEAQRQFEELLTDCVRMRLMSDVPLGAFLSGGVDSSAVVALMSRLTKEPVKTFSVGYDDDPASSELSWARLVARRFKTDHHEYVLQSGDFFQSLDLLLEHAEEPIVEGAAVALYRLSKLAREHVTVILSGEGGDEALAGYPLYQIMPKVDRVRSLLRWAPRSLLALFGKTEKRMKYLDWIRSPLGERYRSIPSDVTASIKDEMYEDSFREAAGTGVSNYFEGLFNALPRATSLRKMSYVDIKSWLPEDLLLKADKMTMAASLELRVPFLDYRLIEFCTSLPDGHRLRGGQGKYLLKKTMEKYLPREIVYRKKKGFPVPMAAWFRGKLSDLIREILLDPKSLSRGYFKKTYVEKVLRNHQDGREDLSRRIFSLLTLELWHRKYAD